MTDWGYYLLYSFAWVLSHIPFWIMYRIADLLYIVNYYIVGYRKNVVFKNLHLAFPDKTDKEIKTIAKAFYRHFSDFIVEYVKCLTLSEKEQDKRFHFVNIEMIRKLEQEKKNIALVSAHYNNWEWMTLFPVKIEHRFLVIYRPLNNRSIDRLSRTMRGRYDPVMVPMEHVYKEALQCIAEGKLFTIWFLADQRPPRNNRFWTRFLNQEVSFFEGVEKLSRRLDLAVLFLDIRKKKRGYYEVYLNELIHDTKCLPENQVMLTCIKAMEEEIYREPAYWLWSHNRFKFRRPENIKLIES